MRLSAICKKTIPIARKAALEITGKYTFCYFLGPNEAILSKWDVVKQMHPNEKNYRFASNNNLIDYLGSLCVQIPRVILYKMRSSLTHLVTPPPA